MSYIKKEWGCYEFKTKKEVVEWLDENADDIIGSPSIVWYDGIFLVFAFRSLLYY